MPVSGWIASLKRLGEPPTHRFHFGGVRNRPWMWKVSTPWPNRDTGRSDSGTSIRPTISMSAGDIDPFHCAAKAHGERISQPWALAMFSGRQR